MWYRNFFVLMLSSFMAFSYGKHIMLEIDEILFQVDETISLKRLPFFVRPLVEKMTDHFTKKYLELLAKDIGFLDDKDIGEVAETFHEEIKKTPAGVRQEINAIPVLFRGEEIPPLMKAYLLDAVTNEEAINRAKKLIEESSCGRIDRYAFNQAAEVGFGANEEIEFLVPAKKAINFIQRLKEQGHQVYIFSNKSVGTLRRLIKKFPDIFESFNLKETFISGNMKRLKPNPEAYEIVLQYFERNGVPKKDIIFIEGLLEYQEMADKVGASSLVWSEDQADTILEALGKVEIILPC